MSFYFPHQKIPKGHRIANSTRKVPDINHIRSQSNFRFSGPMHEARMEEGKILSINATLNYYYKPSYVFVIKGNGVHSRGYNYGNWLVLQLTAENNKQTFPEANGSTNLWDFSLPKTDVGSSLRANTLGLQCSQFQHPSHPPQMKRKLTLSLLSRRRKVIDTPTEKPFHPHHGKHSSHLKNDSNDRFT